jgi:hypothetical protein
MAKLSDSRISAVPPFPGLRRFADGRDFKQWTGDDSKALMKVCARDYRIGSDWIGHTNHIIQGICCRDCWLCPVCNGPLCCGFHGCLLHCPSKSHLLSSSRTLSKLCPDFSSTTHHLCRGRSSYYTLPSAPARFEALLRCNSPLWLPKWTLLINHRIKAHSSGQATLAAI